MNNRELADRLCLASVPLRDAYRAHLEAHGTLVPHIFMNAVLARVGWCLRRDASKSAADDRAEVAGILASLEDGMVAGDREARNVIAISFVDDGRSEPFFGALLPLLGPRVGAQVGR